MDIDEQAGVACPLEPGSYLPPEVNEVLVKARSSWLKNNEVLELLHGYQQGFQLAISGEAPQQPTGGKLYLFNKNECRFFRKDGVNWKKKPDGKTVRETHEKLKVGDTKRINCYYAHADQDDGLQRRCYWLLEESQAHIVLVHYLNCVPNRGPEQHAGGRHGNRRRAPRGGQHQQQYTAAGASGSVDVEMVDMWGSAASGGSAGLEGDRGNLPALPSASAELPSLSTGLPLPAQFGLPSLQQQYVSAVAAVQEQQRRLMAAQPLSPQEQQGQQAGFAFLQQLTQWLGQQQAQLAVGQGPAVSDEVDVFGTDVPVRDAAAAAAEAGAGPAPALAAGPQYLRQRSGIIPQVSLELSHLSNLDDSLAGFLAQLEQPEEGAGNEEAQGAGVPPLRRQPSRGLSRQSSGMSKLLQQLLEAGGVQALPQLGGGGGDGSLLSNCSWLEQLEGALSCLPALSSLPNWQPDLEVPLLDSAEGGSGEGDEGAKQAGRRPSPGDWPPGQKQQNASLQGRREGMLRSLFRLVSTAATVRHQDGGGGGAGGSGIDSAARQAPVRVPSLLPRQLRAQQRQREQQEAQRRQHEQQQPSRVPEEGEGEGGGEVGPMVEERQQASFGATDSWEADISLGSGWGEDAAAAAAAQQAISRRRVLEKQESVMQPPPQRLRATASGKFRTKGR